MGLTSSRPRYFYQKDIIDLKLLHALATEPHPQYIGIDVADISAGLGFGGIEEEDVVGRWPPFNVTFCWLISP